MRRGTRTPVGWVVVACTGWLALSAAAWAQEWMVATVTTPSGAEAGQAVVEGDDGLRLRVVRRGGARSAVCTLDLPAQAAAVAADGRLRVRVDEREPMAVMRWATPEDMWEDGEDFMEHRRRVSRVVPLLEQRDGRFGFECWRGLPRQASPASGLLREMLEGDRIVFELLSGEDTNTLLELPLTGARQAIGEALEIPVEASPEDRVQEALLAFRVEYRGETCYLRPRKKFVERCLKAVRTCATRSHDTVLSMVECVEGR